ncbi:MAG: hypothetical protein WBB45_05565 [Cyclobacteriaceae bacterium]
MSDLELQELESLSQSIPYSQPVHIAMAIKKHYEAANDHMADKAVQEASLFAFDRRRFKSFLQDGVTPVPQFTYTSGETVVTSEPEQENTPEESNSPAVAKTAKTTSSPVATEAEESEVDVTPESHVHSEIEETLRNLKQARESAAREDTPETISKEDISEGHTDAAGNIPAKDNVESDEAKKDRDGSTQTITTPEENSVTDYAPLHLDRDRKKEQMELINQFIEKSPSITKGNVLRTPDGEYEGKDMSVRGEDLADNHLISENLANILVKQGKNNRAIKIYEKLILKFPQKKSYFATRIEELKSNG